MKKLNIVAVIGVVIVALGLLAAVVFKTTAASGGNDMSDLLPKPRTGGGKAPMNPYAAQMKADGGKGGRRPPPAAGQ